MTRFSVCPKSQQALPSHSEARTARLPKNDADAGLQRLGRGRDARAQAAAADRHENGV